MIDVKFQGGSMPETPQDDQTDLEKAQEQLLEEARQVVPVLDGCPCPCHTLRSVYGGSQVGQPHAFRCCVFPPGFR